MSKKINLIYTCDDSYLPLVSISLKSFEKNNLNTKFNVYIATEKSGDTENFIKLKEFHSNSNIIFLDCRMYDDIFDYYNLDKWGSKSNYVYWRMVAFDLVDVDYAYYVDTDIVCLKELKYPEIDNKVCGMVYDSVHSIYHKYLNIERSFPLFNTGVIYTDVRKWKSQKCTERCIDYIKNNKKKFLLADQDYISFALQEDIYAISPKYNFFAGYDYYGIDDSYYLYKLEKKIFYSKELLKKAQKDPILYHCLDGVFGRPWYKRNNHPLRKKYEEFIKISAWSNYRINRKEKINIKMQRIVEENFPKLVNLKIHEFANRIRIAMNYLIK